MIKSRDSDSREQRGLGDGVWDVFELDDETSEPEPEYGDFWGELDDDCQSGS
jgi:hypothetical protein